MSYRTCPDWPELMEIAPDLQFKHYTVSEAQLPGDALVTLDPATLEEIEICCDLERHVFYLAAIRTPRCRGACARRTGSTSPSGRPRARATSTVSVVGIRVTVVLSGGVGGARFLRGLVEVVEPSAVTVIGNVGDDVEVLGLHVSPDLDSILYALAGVADEERGWGRADETWQAIGVVAGLGGEAWFQLGDRDLGLHLVRTQPLRGGEPLSAVTRSLAEAFGVEVALLPATDDPLCGRGSTRPPARSRSRSGSSRRQHRDEVDRVRFDGEATATPAPACSTRSRRPS